MHFYAIPANPWLYLLIFVVVMIVGILLLAVITSLSIAWAAGKYSDRIIPQHAKQIENLLPGTNCGQCKCESCAEFADKVLHTEIDEDRCPFCDEKTQDRMLAVREHLQKLMEDPTPVRKDEPRFWERKFGPRNR